MAQPKPAVRFVIALYSGFGAYLLAVGAFYLIRLLSGGGMDYLFVSPAAIAVGLFFAIYIFRKVEIKDSDG